MNSIEKKDFWQSHIEGCSKSELSQVEYCAVHKIPLSTFSYWKRKLNRDISSQPIFYPLVIPSAQTEKLAGKETGLTLHLQDKRFSIEIEKGFSASTLAHIVSTLEKL